MSISTLSDWHFSMDVYLTSFFHLDNSLIDNYITLFWIGEERLIIV